MIQKFNSSASSVNGLGIRHRNRNQKKTANSQENDDSFQSLHIIISENEESYQEKSPRKIENKSNETLDKDEDHVGSLDCISPDSKENNACAINIENATDITKQEKEALLAPNVASAQTRYTSSDQFIRSPVIIINRIYNDRSNK